jgi:MFS family permease
VRAAFRVAGYPRLFLGLTTSMLGDSVMLLVLSMWVKTLTGSNAQAGFTFFFLAVPALFAPLLGVWVDRLPRRAVLVWGHVLSAAMVLPLLLVDDAGDVWLIWLVAFCYGISFVMLPAALNGVLKDLLPEDLLVDANSSLATTREAFRLVGPLAGALLFTWAGGGAVALVDAATFLVAAGYVTTIHVAETPVTREERFRDEVLAGVRHLRSDRVLGLVLVGLAAAVLVIGFSESAIYALLDAFDRPATWASGFVTCMGVGAIAGGLSAGPVVRRTGEVAGCALGLGIFGVATGVCAVAPTLTVVFVGAGVMGVGTPLVYVALNTLLQRRSPRELVGRVSAAVDITLAVPQVVSLALGAVLVVVFDYRVIFGIIAAVMVLGGLQIAVSLRDQIRADLARGGTPVAAEPDAASARRAADVLVEPVVEWTDVSPGGADVVDDVAGGQPGR